MNATITYKKIFEILDKYPKKRSKLNKNIKKIFRDEYKRNRSNFYHNSQKAGYIILLKVGKKKSKNFRNRRWIS